MQVVLLRHAIAEDRASSAKSDGADAQRALTEKGAKRMRRGARGLRRALDGRLDRIATSPYLRAVQTAQLLADSFNKSERPEICEVEALAPGSEPAAALAWLGEQPQDTRIVLVGHEPNLSELLTYCVVPAAANFLHFGKGGAALLAFAEAPRPGSATLQWLLTPAVLRRLGV